MVVENYNYENAYRFTNPTSGTAKVFEQEMTENSLKMRENVGYMTQAFSLYSELCK